MHALELLLVVDIETSSSASQQQTDKDKSIAGFPLIYVSTKRMYLFDIVRYI